VVSDVSVIKRNITGKETWRYRGEVIERTRQAVVLQAFFDRDDLNIQGLVLRRGDRFREAYFSDRWYNLFEIHDRDTDALKGFYCNITYPASIKEEEISYIDLALDLLVFADGRQVVLDEDEFALLDIVQEDRKRAEDTLADLQSLFQSHGNALIQYLMQDGAVD